MINDYILYGKKLLVQEEDRLPAFIQSVQLRTDEAIKRMKLPSEKIITTCICSIEKESFIIQDNDNILVYMDKHQMDSLFMLMLLYDLYGQVDIKYGLFMHMYEAFPYFEKRLSFALLVLQAEKCFNRGDLVQAEAYMDAADRQEYALEFTKLCEKKPEDFRFVANLINTKGIRQDISYCFALNFYVFHEYAHAKYTLAKEDLTYFINAVEEILFSSESVYDYLFDACSMERPVIPIEEYVCDTYSLYLLFDFVYEQTKDYEAERMVDSYFISVLNLALIHCNNSIKMLSEDDYLYASFRAIHAIRALLLLWEKENRPSSAIRSIEKVMGYSYQRYKNLKLTIDTKWRQLFVQHHKTTKAILSYNEEKTLASQLINRFSRVV